MSSTSTKISLFSIDSFTLSNNSLFSVDEYNHLGVAKGHRQHSYSDVMQRSKSFFSIEPVSSCGLQQMTGCAKSDKGDTSSDEACVTKPLTFKRISRQVSVKRFNFLTSDRQIAIDTSRSCCGSQCLSKFGKTNLRVLREKYLSLNGEGQDTFLISHMQLVLDHTLAAKSVHMLNITLHFVLNVVELLSELLIALVLRGYMSNSTTSTKGIMGAF